ncbi:MAG: anaerobic ribonucleoside triphosphate reductase [Acholeplasmatales bacterium]|jgi:ribonucleoside-triphosphate reductase|nr:anaerobic ribonucleoside triphosphate reductase [Acholeplasmatales bacterium]
MVKKVKKRDGRYSQFNQEKIGIAIKKAFEADNKQIKEENLDEIVSYVVDIIENTFTNKIPKVEDIQDIVETALIHFDYASVAKRYILYRQERSIERDKNTRLMKTFQDITYSKSNDSDLKRENANIDSDTPMGAMLKYGSEAAKEFNKMWVLPAKYSKAHEEGLIHIHDLDFLTLTLTCCQIDLTKLFKDGFKTGHGSVREPQDIKTYAALACIAIQSNQNDQHGGQSIAKFDYDMAGGVRKTYVKRYVANLQKITEFLDININAKEEIAKIKNEYNVVPKMDNDEINSYVLPIIGKEHSEKIFNFVTKNSKSETIRDTYQAMESLIHNLNTMHSRAGAQVPFSSINYGTDTSVEGRIVTEQILKATLAGMGENETPIFPIQIFKLKEGVNYYKEDPNYDLFELAIKTTAKRLFPNFSFVDAPFNLQYYNKNNPDSEIAYMGCRTRVIANYYDKENEIVTGRGNLSFTSINLPRLALLNNDVNKFFVEFDKTIDLVIEQLLNRFEIQRQIHVYNFPFLMGQHVWTKSDHLKYTDTIDSVIRQGTLSIGFIGLAEALKVLTGHHHGEDDSSQELGLKIVSHLRKRTDEACEKYNLNFSCLATPAEGLSGRFVKIDKKIFGEIEGVTNHAYYTNSFHVPVYYNTNACHKIDIEAPYHTLTNGGHISYVELDGDASKNTTAIEKIIRYMHDKGIGYGSVNHAVDFDPVCGYVGIIDDVCPKCGRVEGDIHFDRIRRITGYLVGSLDRFNDAKRHEVDERVKHIK